MMLKRSGKTKYVCFVLNLEGNAFNLSLLKMKLVGPCTTDPPQRAEVGGQWSQPDLVPDWPVYISPIDLPTANKAQMQEEDVLSPHKWRTSSTQLG